MSFKVAKLLKEKGFNGKSFHHYYYHYNEDTAKEYSYITKLKKLKL